MFRTVEAMRILVTGATGYVGSRLVDQGRDVVAAIRDPEKLGRSGWCDDVTGPLRTGLDLLVKAHRP
jgi:uncharacterized protein YbjT (DUF2867 family)